MQTIMGARSAVLRLGDPEGGDAAQVGGKAAQLSRLANDYRVPPGFSLTTAAYDPAYSPGMPLPAVVEAEVAAAYGALSRDVGVPDVPVAVRSSALDEDGELASFAGQHETELNVVGIDAVLGAVARNWASARSERALAYRKWQGLQTSGVRLAVLIQQLVLADTSAVIFSANPITGDRDEVVVTASWGLGESVVSGTVTPDTWVVRKAHLAVKEERIGAKERMVVATDGGTREVAVPRLLRERASLSEAQVVELAKLAVELEGRMGRPVDVEAAYAGELLYLLQCRPITTLGEPGRKIAS
jgi:phosphoenolpyruvate synthase/pyruvate phosphate dikinase